MLLALRCFHSICENCEALPLRKTLLRCCNHALAHLAAACACARCITRVAQLIICFRVHGCISAHASSFVADARRRGVTPYAHIPHVAQLRHRSARAEPELPRRDALDAVTMKLPENQSNARALSALGRSSIGARSKTPLNRIARAQASSAATAT